MCGRYGRRADKQHIAEHYAIRRVQYEDMPEEHPFAFAPDYNIAPDSFQPVVRLSRESGERQIAIMKWGLVPFWSKTPKASFSSINVRADSLETSAAWREPWKFRRCLIPAEVFYEWEPKTAEMKKKKISKPWAITLTDSRLFSFAGIYDHWHDKTTGERLHSFSIVTVDPNELLEPFHDRCPLILEPKDYSRWLTPYLKDDPSTLPQDLLRTPPSEVMKAWRVKPIGAGANGLELLDPVTAADCVQSLFEVGFPSQRK
jgi:putative SOS response-associated peptidase YedK